MATPLRLLLFFAGLLVTIRLLHILQTQKPPVQTSPPVHPSSGYGRRNREEGISNVSEESPRDSHSHIYGEVVSKKIIEFISEDAGFRIMSLIMKKRLHNNLVKHSDSTKFTIFAPGDEAASRFGRGRWISLEFQIATSKADKHDIDHRLKPVADVKPCRKDIFLNACHKNKRLKSLIINRKASINNIRIARWDDIYNDGNFSVHGVEDFFDLDWTVRQYSRKF